MNFLKCFSFWKYISPLGHYLLRTTDPFFEQKIVLKRLYLEHYICPEIQYLYLQIHLWNR